MSDFPADVQKIRQQLQTALEQAAQWQQRYEAQTPKPSSLASRHPSSAPEPPPSQPDRTQAIPAEIRQVTDVTELQGQLAQAQAQIAQLTTALAQERTNHAKTRQNLTNALADAIENLTRLRNQPPKTP